MFFTKTKLSPVTFNFSMTQFHVHEIARMNNEFNETDTAIKFYRLAANTAIGKFLLVTFCF